MVDSTVGPAGPGRLADGVALGGVVLSVGAAVGCPAVSA